DHNCTGDDCQLCQAVNVCLPMFHNMSPDPDTGTATRMFFYALVLVIGEVSMCLAASSLISLKVKLSN
ncbi:MAG: hypothetical protein IJ077_02245, partial [Eubacterium sp.]|nr:hypothetical protein [Eubacterium sp.]